MHQEPSCRPIRVLFVVPASPLKASMVFARREIASLQRCGVVCETFLLTTRSSLWILLRQWRELRKAIRFFRPHVIHAQYGTVTAFLSCLSSVPAVFVTYYGSDLNPSPSVPWLRSLGGRLLSQLASLAAAQIICVSEQLRTRLWWRKNRAIVIPTGVDTEVFYPRSRDEARAELGWGNAEPVVLFNAGGDPRIKRLDLAQAAVSAVGRICGEVRFVVLNGDVAPEYIPAMMNAADCLLLTSDWEGSPNVVKEAMACNLPVVAVDAGDVRQRLEGVWPSRIVERNANALGEALAGILMLHQRSNGSTKVRDLSSAVIAQRIISLYRAAITSESEVPQTDTRETA